MITQEEVIRTLIAKKVKPSDQELRSVTSDVNNGHETSHAATRPA